jgi:transcriptional regulator with XRE-family HTH domain
LVDRPSPAVRRRRLGNELRSLRERAGLTIDVVADRLDFSSSKVSRIETGHTGASAADVRAMVGLYGLDGHAADALVQIAREAKAKGWWLQYGKVLIGRYVGLEAGASKIYSFEAQLVPGLLQLPGYTRLLIRAARPDLTDEELDDRIRIRDKRRALIDKDENPIDFWAIIDEAVLHRMVGGASLMRRQIEKLQTVAERPNVTIQVIPFGVGVHAGMDGSFSILEYEDEADPDVVFAENAAGGLFMEKEEDLRRYRFVFDRLQASALTPELSAEFLAKRAKEL